MMQNVTDEKKDKFLTFQITAKADEIGVNFWAFCNEPLACSCRWP
jgi:hypothetical protein